MKRKIRLKKIYFSKSKDLPRNSYLESLYIKLEKNSNRRRRKRERR